MLIADVIEQGLSRDPYGLVRDRHVLRPGPPDANVPALFGDGVA